MLRKREIVALLLVISLAGCTGWPAMKTKINENHSLIQSNSGQYASVYFIRPRTERYMGASDNRLKIELDREILLELKKANYALVYLKPGNVDVTIKSETIAGPFRKLMKMERTKRFEFEPGSTYYITIEPVDGEFRGVYFLPHLVDLARAEEAARHILAVGNLAKNARLIRK